MQSVPVEPVSTAFAAVTTGIVDTLETAARLHVTAQRVTDINVSATLALLALATNLIRIAPVTNCTATNNRQNIICQSKQDAKPPWRVKYVTACSPF